jgi:hypothetical protein
LKAVFTVIPIFGRLDGETKSDFARAVEKLKQMIANETAKLALPSWSRRELDPTITGAALGTNDVGLAHVRKVSIVVPVILRERMAASVRRPLVSPASFREVPNTTPPERNWRCSLDGRLGRELFDGICAFVAVSKLARSVILEPCIHVWRKSRFVGGDEVFAPVSPIIRSRTQPRLYRTMS